VYCKDSEGERTAGTLTWLPDQIAMPNATPQDMVQAAIPDLTTVLQHPIQGKLAEHLQLSATDKIQELSEIFTNNNDTAGQDPRQVLISPETSIQMISTIKRNTQQIPKHPN
jgi:hypothetical protein